MSLVPFTGKRAAGLDVPVVVLDGVEVESVGELCRSHGSLEILLVRKDEYLGRSERLVGARTRQVSGARAWLCKLCSTHLMPQHLLEFLLHHFDVLAICAIDHQDHRLFVPPARLM